MPAQGIQTDTPVEHASKEFPKLRLRSTLMRELGKSVRSWGISQSEAAKRLSITQPRLNALLNGKIEKFSLDALVNLTSAAQLSVQFCVFQSLGAKTYA